ncbi:MAG: permease prefix domain 1-containing protein, partial [Verrucomicrobia bacterium]|nr:permease prefix domain 1-containing protein [Verrucomicrobiota bacterium]
MRFFHRTLNHCRALLRRRRLDADLAEELRLHLEHRTEENIAAGMSPADARDAATRQFGGVEQVKERCRDARRWTGLEQLLQDLRFAVRSLLRTPGFTAVAVLTLALGIGLNSAMFSLANVVLLRPLPFAEPAELMQVHRTSPQNQRGPFSA